MKNKAIAIITALFMVFTMIPATGIAVFAADMPAPESTESAEVTPNGALSISDLDISYTYENIVTGNAIKPKVTVKYNGNPLYEGTHYSVTYKEMVEPGLYEDGITLTAIAPLSGSKTLPVLISKKTEPVKPPAFSTKIIKVSTTKAAPYVQYNAVKVKGATKTTYNVKYKTSATGAWKTAASATTKTKLTIKALAGKKNYAVIVTPSIVYSGKTYKGPAALKYNNITKPAGTAISTATEFTSKISKNPSGKFYLVNSITLPANTQIKEKFTGTLDGNGFAITGYKYTASSYSNAAVFDKASGATFKNLKMTGVNMNVNSSSGSYIGALTRYTDKCTFNNVKVAGKITVTSGDNGSGQGCYVGGISAAASYSTYKNCTNDIDITLKASHKYFNATASGITTSNSGGSVTGCTNTGKITLSGYADGMSAAGLIAGGTDKIVNCKNNAAVAVTIGAKTEGYGDVTVSGVCGNARKSITGCKNTAAVTVTGNSASVRNIFVAGVVGTMTSNKGIISKCANKGAVKFTGKLGGGSSADNGLRIGGVTAEGSTGQCYNKGTVTATVNKGFARVGGLAGIAYEISNSYNAGAVKLTGKGFVGGLAGDGVIYFDKATCNYNSGAITGSKFEARGAIFGMYSGHPYEKTTYNNYYKNNIKAIGKSQVTNKYKPTSIKVSAITKKKCPKLSSNYWKYSGKVKRMILKNNSEL